MKISLIAAMDDKRGIGKQNKLLFAILADRQRFRTLTKNHMVIMGRKTFESILSFYKKSPLLQHANIVVSRSRDFSDKGVITAKSLEEALRIAEEKLADKDDEIFVIGGGQIYQEAIGTADKLYLTLVKGNFGADTFFPDYAGFKKIVKKEEHHEDGFDFTFLDLEK